MNEILLPKKHDIGLKGRRPALTYAHS